MATAMLQGYLSTSVEITMELLYFSTWSHFRQMPQPDGGHLGWERPRRGKGEALPRPYDSDDCLGAQASLPAFLRSPRSTQDGEHLVLKLRRTPTVLTVNHNRLGIVEQPFVVQLFELEEIF